MHVLKNCWRSVYLGSSEFILLQLNQFKLYYGNLKHSSLTAIVFMVGGKKKEDICFQNALSTFQAEYHDCFIKFSVCWRKSLVKKEQISIGDSEEMHYFF